MATTSRARWLGLTMVAVTGTVLLAWWIIAERERHAREAIEQGRACLRAGRPALALRLVERLPRGGEGSAEALTVKGLALAALDRPDDARQVLERSLAIRPGQPMALKVLAATYLGASDVERGLATLRQAARLDPADFRPWYAMGDVFDQLERPVEAVWSYREALRRKPNDGESRYRLVAALLEANKADEATSPLDEVRRERPDDPKVAYLAARHAWALGRPEDASRFADQALALDPDDRGALVLRSQLRQRSGRPDLALADAEHAVGLDPTDPAALNQLGLAEAASGLKDRAAATAARSRRVMEQRARMHKITEEIRARPDDPGPRWRLGQAAAESGATPLAVRSFRAALHLDPDCQPALQGLASLGVPIPVPPPAGAP